MGESGAVTGGITKNSSGTGLTLQKPYLRVASVYHNRLELDDLAIIGVTESEYAKTVLRVGDLLIVEGNGSLQQVGRFAIWEKAGLDCVHQNHLIRWRSSGVLSKWTLYWLMSPVRRDLLEQRAKSTTGLHPLSVSKVSGLPIAVPGLAEQDEIITHVEALFSLADQLEARLTAARQVVARLTPALLAKLLEDCGALSEKALLAASELEPRRFEAQLVMEQQAGRVREIQENGQQAWEVMA